MAGVMGRGGACLFLDDRADRPGAPATRHFAHYLRISTVGHYLTKGSASAGRFFTSIVWP